MRSGAEAHVLPYLVRSWLQRGAVVHVARPEGNGWLTLCARHLMGHYVTKDPSPNRTGRCACCTRRLNDLLLAAWGTHARADHPHRPVRFRPRRVPVAVPLSPLVVGPPEPEEPRL